MAYEQKDMSGSLFKNQKKEKDSHPNATGTALIDGVEYWVSAWTKFDKNSQPWQSLAFKRKDSKPHDDRQSKPQSYQGHEDDIPF